MLRSWPLALAGVGDVCFSRVSEVVALGPFGGSGYFYRMGR